MKPDKEDTYYNFDKFTQDLLTEIYFCLMEVRHNITYDIVKRSIAFLTYHTS